MVAPTWNATTPQSGAAVTATSISHNAAIAFGFTATGDGSAAPTGVACTGP